MISYLLPNKNLAAITIAFSVFCFQLSNAETKTKCNANCDFKILDILANSDFFLLSKDSSYLIAVSDYNSIQVVDIGNAQSRTLLIGSSSYYDIQCNPFLNQCMIQDQNTPKKLDLSKSFQDLNLQVVSLPYEYAQTPVLIASISQNYTFLIQKFTKKCIIFDNSNLSIVVQQDSPSQVLPSSDGKSLLIFEDLDNCIYKFDAKAKLLLPIYLKCTYMTFTDKHIIEYPDDQDTIKFYSKDTFQQQIYNLDLQSISIDQKYTYVPGLMQDTGLIKQVNIEKGQIKLIKNITANDDCNQMPTFDQASLYINNKYIVALAFSQDQVTQSMCFYKISNGDSNTFPIWAIILIVVLGLAIIVGVILGIYCYKKKKRMRMEREDDQGQQYDRLEREPASS